jgi:type IV secretion system protein VirB11
VRPPDTLRVPSHDDYAELQATAAAISRTNFDALLGPLRQYLDDPRTYNVNVNPDGAIFVEHAERGKFRAPETMDRAAREALIGNLANRNGKAVDALHARLDCDLPYYRVRVQAFAPPVADWPLMLRAHARRVYALEEHHLHRVSYASSAALEPTRDALAAVRAAIRRRDNILVSGRPGAGKTTYLNALLREAAIARPHERLVLIEDRPELQPSHADALSLLARVEQAAPDGRRYTYSFPDALADALRTDFDALVWGELRTGESAQGLLLAANTGVRGIMATIHADSAADTLQRVEDLVRLAGAPAIRRTIARFVQLVVHLEMAPDRSERYVSEVVRVLGVDDHDEYQLDAADGSRARFAAAATTHGKESRTESRGLGDGPCA